MPNPLFRIPSTIMLLILGVTAICTSCASKPEIQMIDARSESGIAYDLQGGDGPFIVLIHGSNLDRRLWQKDVSWLKQQARVLTYDWRGQGQSEFPKDAYSNHEDLIQLLGEIDAGPAILIGLSAGSQIALDVALIAPELVDQLILVSPSLSGYVPKKMPPFLAALMSALRSKDFDQANNVLIASDMMNVPEMYRDLVGDMIRTNGKLWEIPYELVRQVETPAIKRLGEVKQKTLVLVGDKDLTAIQAQANLLAIEIPNAELSVVSRGNHLLNLASPEEFKEAVQSFIWPAAKVSAP